MFPLVLQYAPSRPLRHLVAFKCAEGSQAKVDALDAALGALSTTIALDHSFHFGPDMGLREPGYNMDYTITADFSDEAAYQAFCSHPAYVKVVNELIKPLLAPGEPVAVATDFWCHLVPKEFAANLIHAEFAIGAFDLGAGLFRASYLDAKNET